MSTEPADSAGRRFSRRSFIKGVVGSTIAAAAGFGGTSCDKLRPSAKKSFSGRIAGADRNLGHRLLQQGQVLPDHTEKTGIVIVGGGIAGLSAARELQKNRNNDFVLLELDSNVGGNAVCGSNAVSPYPWGAHYVPIPGKDAVFVRELFEELGIIEGYDGRGLPVYNEFYLCADPMERLLIHGRWQEGLIPQLGLTEKDKRQYREFFETMDRLKKAEGNDGRPAFSIPIDRSSSDERFRRYDAISMGRYMSDNGWDSEYLRWYINYCCRDDYGLTMDRVSAWAGMHYFAARSGTAANADPHAVVTWPEGNGWIVNRMAEKFRGNIRCDACVLSIEQTAGGAAVDYYDADRKTVVRLLSKAVVYAAPRFTAFRVIRDFREKPPEYASRFVYAPWMVANVTVRGIPEGNGAALAWDNVCYNSESLGYVVANHQEINRHREKTVLTCYFPLTSGPPEAERKRAAGMSYDAWAGLIVKDLSYMHSGIENYIEELDVWVWGHAMPGPTPGFIWGKARFQAMRPLGRIFFAHSDMSGISIFEEAQYRGILAARASLKI